MSFDHSAAQLLPDDDSPFGHTSSVLSLAFSRDSKRLATASFDGTVRVWDIASRTPRLTVRPDGFSDWGFDEVAFLPDDRSVFATVYPFVTYLIAKDGAARRWSVSPDEYLTPLAGGLMLRQTTAGIHRIWDILNDKLVREFDASEHCEQRTFFSAALSHDGETLAVNDNRAVRVFDLLTMTPRWSAPLPSHAAREFSCCFSSDDRYFAYACARQPPRIVSVARGKPIATLLDDGRGALHAGMRYHRLVCLTGDGRTAVTAGDERRVCIWNLQSCAVVSLLCAPDLLSPPASLQMRSVWSGEGRGGAPPFFAHDGRMRDIAISPDGQTLATAGDDHVVRLWDTRSWRHLATLGRPKNEVRCLAVARDARTVVAGYKDGAIRAWNVADGRFRLRADAHPGGVRLLALADNRLLTCSLDSVARGWTYPDLRHEATFELPNVKVKSIHITRDGKKAAVAGMRSNQSWIWHGELPPIDVAKPTAASLLEESGRLPVDPSDCHSLTVMAMSHHGELIAFAKGNIVYLWHAADRSVVARFQVGDDHWHAPSAMAFENDDRTLVVGTGGYQIAIIDLMTCHMRDFRTERDSAAALAISPDGRTLAVGTHYAHTIWLHDLRTGKITAELRGHTASITSLAYVGDTGLLASGGSDGMIKLWRGDKLERSLALP